MADTTPSRKKVVAMRMDSQLHSEASALAKMTGVSLRDLVEDGLRMIVSERLQGDQRLAAVVREMVEYKQRRDAPEPSAAEEGE